MRKVVFEIATSLDGFITGDEEALDWLLWGEEAGARVGALWKRVDTLLMGRKTYDFAARSGGGDDGSSKIRTCIFSRTMTEAPKGAELVRDDAGGFVRALKQQDGGDIYAMGGGDLAATLLDAGVVDQLGLNIHPVLLGSGTPLFPGLARRVDLELAECVPMKNGCVLLSYSVKA